MSKNSLIPKREEEIVIEGSHRSALHVELIGIEPTTSALQKRRSPN